MPVLESLGHVEVHHPLRYLDKLPHEPLVAIVVLSDGFPACSKNLQVPFFSELLGSFSHVSGHLSSLVPFSDSFSLSDVQHVLVKNFSLHSECLQNLAHLDESVVCASQLFGLNDSLSSLMLRTDNV